MVYNEVIPPGSPGQFLSWPHANQGADYIFCKLYTYPNITIKIEKILNEYKGSDLMFFVN